jgi:glycosyltransferase involved in cell wall biosynthesis
VRSCRISVVVPVYNDAGNLRACLSALRDSDAGDFELIVADDGSTDNSIEVAREFGAKVCSTGGRKGPAHARNIGAAVATGDILAFFDADVCVQRETLSQIQAAFEEEPGLDALIGSYDDKPVDGDFLSQYKNLMHCYVHQRGRQQATTFWSGCGAVRREVFVRHSGFSESYGRPAIEDIELGYRMHQSGCKMMLDPTLQVKHLKKWTFWKLVKTDVLDRGIPWTELILRDKHMPDDLNIQVSQRVSVALVFVLVALATYCAVSWGGAFLTPLFGGLFVLLARYWGEAAGGKRSRGGVIAVSAIVLTLVGLAYYYRMLALIPMIVLSYGLLFLRHQRAGGGRFWKIERFLFGSFIGLTIMVFLAHLPNHRLVYSFFLVLVLVIVLNNQFYVFLSAKRGRFFMLAALPFHLLYHLYNGVSFTIGLAVHAWRTLISRKPVMSPSRTADEQRQ